MRTGVATIVSLVAPVLVAGCVTFYDVSVETPVRAKLDVSPFPRVLIAGFIRAGTEDVDANVETMRILRSQLRSKSLLTVVEADVLPAVASAADTQRIFADVQFWKRVGEEYQDPLIVTGTVRFTVADRSRFVQRGQETFDSVGRRQVRSDRTFDQAKVYVLEPRFIFIDGRTGTIVYSETFREEASYDQSTNRSALSSYFELMDRLVPTVLSTVSDQTLRGNRTLLK